MGLFSKQPKEESWVDEVESFANYVGDLKYATDQIIDAAVDGDEELVQMIWDNMTTEQRQYGFWFLLEAIATIFREEYQEE